MYYVITCKGKPILLGRRDESGRYRISLMQQKGKWQPNKATKAARKILQEANSVYGLPVETLLWEQVSGATYVDHGQTVVTIAGHVVVSLAG